jgi:hypothetical protein
VYGAGFSRDVEPSRENGATLYNIMASCVKMFKNGNNGCTSVTTQEPCCIGATCGRPALSNGPLHVNEVLPMSRMTNMQPGRLIPAEHRAGTSFNARYKYVSTGDGVLGIRSAAATGSVAFYQCTVCCVSYCRSNRCLWLVDLLSLLHVIANNLRRFVLWTVL